MPQPPRWAPDHVRGVRFPCGKVLPPNTALHPGSPVLGCGVRTRRSRRIGSSPVPGLRTRRMPQPSRWAWDQVRGVSFPYGKVPAPGTDYVPALAPGSSARTRRSRRFRALGARSPTRRMPQPPCWAPDHVRGVRFPCGKVLPPKTVSHPGPLRRDPA
ncbi:PH domain-containing protein [Microbaculum marinum]|uniref:PH domain-containing protein n=1 Tax=Microbaculum marinum TaxID=1764581 RepID=UPI00361DFDAA